MIETMFLVGAIAAICFGFHALDKWHQRKAWRDATREAARILGREDRRLINREAGGK